MKKTVQDLINYLQDNYTNKEMKIVLSQDLKDNYTDIQGIIKKNVLVIDWMVERFVKMQEYEI